MPIMDGNWELFSHDHAMKRTVWRYFDGVQTHYRTTCEVGDIVDANREEQNATLNQKWGEWRKVASIPSNLFFADLGEATRQRDNTYVNKYLNDPDNRDFRTFLGRM